MWFYKFEFDCKEESLKDQDLSNIDGYLSGDLSSKEIEDLIYLENKTKSKINYNDWQMPSIQLPEEYKELLSFSNGGHITNGERQFGFFGMQELRSYYIRYLFIEYMCGALPIAFDGGGIFFAYDFRAKIPKIIATESGVLNWEQSAYLGDNLLEVLTAKHNISDELYILTHEQKKKLEKIRHTKF